VLLRLVYAALWFKPRVWEKQDVIATSRRRMLLQMRSCKCGLAACNLLFKTPAALQRTGSSSIMVRAALWCLSVLGAT
jgi:hypothetical protein